MHLHIFFAATSLPSLVLDTGPFAKFILLLLFLMSLLSWAIIVDRSRLFSKLGRKGHALQKKAAADGVGTVMQNPKAFRPSVEAALLAETRRWLNEAGASGATLRIAPDQAVAQRGRLRDALERRATTEVAEMEKNLVFLSTTSGVAPFLGLMGTVWGIMSSFLSMGAQGGASLDVVGPGIAEALLTTIMGLATAIPALVGYNILVRQLQRRETDIDLFISRVVEAAIVPTDEVRRTPSPTSAGV